MGSKTKKTILEWWKSVLLTDDNKIGKLPSLFLCILLLIMVAGFVLNIKR